MEKLISIAGNLAAVLGIVLYVLAATVRLSGGFYVLGFETMTVFTAGMGLVVLACLAKLQSLQGTGSFD